MKRPLIYVRRITNLSDGRYCAGMGVNMLGFVINAGHHDYVSPQQYQEMSGWIAGPERVAELVNEEVDINEIKRSYAPGFLHIPIRLLGQKELQAFPLLVEVPIKSLESAASNLTNPAFDIRYVLITEFNQGHLDLPQKR